MTHLFSIICEFRGGTYISQVRAPDEKRALQKWAEEFAKDNPVPGGSRWVIVAVMRNACDNEGPTPLDGLTNAWCHTAICNRDLILMNIFKTEAT